MRIRGNWGSNKGADKDVSLILTLSPQADVPPPSRGRESSDSSLVFQGLAGLQLLGHLAGLFLALAPAQGFGD